MGDFINMGGYGAFVWPSYILTAVVMGGILIQSIRSLKATQRTFDRLKAETGAKEQTDEA